MATVFFCVNEKNPEGFELTNRTIPKVGFFIEKPINEKYSYNVSITYHNFLENYKYMNRRVGSDERSPFEIAVGRHIYHDLNLSLRYRILNKFYTYGGVFVSYHDNSQTILTSSNPVTGELTFMLKKTEGKILMVGLI